MPPAFAPDGFKNRADVIFLPVFSCRAGTYLMAKVETASNASGGGKKGRAARCFLPYEILRRTCCFMALPCCMRLWLFVHHFICLDGFRSPADFLPMGKMPGERREEAVPRTLEDCDRDPAENILFCKLMRMWRRWNSDTCFTISPATVLPCWCAGLEFWTERSPVFSTALECRESE
ncbi:hypothetical protein CXT95_00440 [Akkermansia muciniphila]|uniref:Uncharacterized protein n=1 Tax=Akkermansia muciniphila TaxID=239935 RepID=A0AAX0WP32_9BACT|nr:hypothetical protein CXT95_00440 [Akkermansia muciniphila]